MKNEWWKSLAEEIQSFADTNDSRQLYAALKTAYGAKSTSSSTCIRSADERTLYIAQQNVLIRWNEHFSTLLNNSSTVCQESLDTTPQLPIAINMYMLPDLFEITNAIRRLKSGKAAGPDGLPPEVFKVALIPLSRKLQPLFSAIWQQSTLPSDLKDAQIIPIYKGKGDRSLCDNYRGIYLLSIN